MRVISLLSLFVLSLSVQKTFAANEEFLTKLNIGWPSQLSQLDQQTNDGRSYLVVVSLQPEPAIDLQNAETFRRSLIEVAADGDESILGHVMFAWKCVSPQGTLQGMSGMTGENHDQIYKMTKAGWGYNAMISTFTDGYLQTAKEIESEEIREKLKKGNTFASFAFEVSPQECAGFYNALSTFVTHPNVPMSRFGSLTSPEQYTGGGCISTALSFFSKSSTLPSIENFRRVLQFKTKFLGKGDAVPKDTELPPANYWQNSKYVYFDTLVFSSWEVKPGEASVSVPMEDPELLIAFIKSVVGRSTNSGLSAGQLTSRLFRSIIPDPHGEDAFGVNRRFSWTRYTKSADTDANYRRMYDLAGSWLAQRNYTYSASMQWLGQNTVLLRK